MKKIDTCLLFIVLAITFISLIAVKLYQSQNFNTHSLKATITLDGQIVKEIMLSEVTTTYTEQISIGNNEFNTIEISHNHIRIIDSSCPDKTCVKHGYVHMNATPAVCLPHKLIITVENTSKNMLYQFTN